MRSSAQFNILALASGTADYNIYYWKFAFHNNSKLFNSKSQAKPRTIQNSKLNIPYTSSPANFTLNPSTVANIISISFQNE